MGKGPLHIRPDRDRGAEEVSDRRYLRRVLLILSVLAGIAAAWRLFQVVMLAFAAVLLALVLRSLAGGLARRTRLPEIAAIAAVVLGLLLAFVGVAWLFGSQIRAQFDLLARDLPAGGQRLVLEIRSESWGAWILEHAQDVNLAAVTGKALAGVGTIFTATLRALTYTAVLLFAALYLAIQPARYRDGLLKLIPSERRQRVEEVSTLAGETLRRWLAGQALTMLIVGALTGGGLWALGIGAPLALGLIAGTFAFVPYVGPVLAAVPGLLMAATQSPVATLYALLVYAGVHLVEGNLVTPMVQAEVVKLPPVLTVFAALVFGLLLGPVGVLLATPLTVVLLIAVNCFYLEDGLGEPRFWPPVGSRRMHGRS